MVTTSLAAAAIFAAAAPWSAFAQDSTSQEVEALKKRLADVESKLASGAGSGDMKWNDFTALGARFKFYGYLRFDAIYDDSRPNNTGVLSWIKSEDPTAPNAFRAPKNSSDFTAHPKLSRFGLDFTGPTISGLGDPLALAKIEVDFYNSTATESRQALRIRQAYVQLKWTSFSLYAGQMWDVISPLNPIVNPDNVMWGAGNLADRRPQLRGEYTQAIGESTFLAQLAAGETGAVDAQDLDPAGGTGTGFRDGEQSGQPTIQGRVSIKMPVGEFKKSVEFGFWAHHASEETDVPVGTNRNFVSGAYGIDLQFPVWEDLIWVKGELWHGRNLDDVRGGILQGVNSNGDEIRAEGGFGEIGFKATDHVSLHAGWSFDNPNNDDLIVAPTNLAPRSRNQIAYAAIRFDYKPIYFGFDYLRWVTGYSVFNEGTDNRFQAFLQYSF